MLKISPSILAADFGCLAREVKRVEDAGADMLHIDVMDGHFVQNLSLGPMIVSSLRSRSRLLFDVHLMVEEPDLFIPVFAKAGADIVTVHAETCHRLYGTIQLIKSLNKKVGITLNPLTPLNFIEYALENVDMVLLMTVEPGFGGQPFLLSVLPKIRNAKKMIDARGLNVDLAVDGGINEHTAFEVVKAGANVLVVGSALFGKKDQKQLRETIENLKKLS